MAGTFRKEFRKKFQKDPENALRVFLEFPSRVRLGCPKPPNLRHSKPPEHFQHSLPLQYGSGRFFFRKWFRRGPLRAGHGIPSSTEGISDMVLFLATGWPNCRRPSCARQRQDKDYTNICRRRPSCCKTTTRQRLYKYIQKVHTSIGRQFLVKNLTFSSIL